MTSSASAPRTPARSHPPSPASGPTFRSDLRIPAEALPPEYGGPRFLGGVLTFPVTPQAPVRWHRIRSDQVYHHYLGDPLEVLLLYPDGRGEVSVVGPDLFAGMRPQLLIPGRTFHAGRVAAGAGYSLLGTSVWAWAEPADVEAADSERLCRAYPAAQAAIAAFTR